MNNSKFLSRVSIFILPILLMTLTVLGCSPINTMKVKTDRLTNHVLTAGNSSKPAVVLVHGNLSSSVFFEELAKVLSKDYYVIAPDLRSYGKSEPLPIKASLGLDDMAKDVISLLDKLNLKKVHIVGHSLGGGVVMKIMLHIPKRLKSAVLISTMSPYGYSGSKDEKGTPCFSDGAPAGAGGTNPEFVKLLKEKDRSKKSQFSPRNIIEQFYFHPPFVPNNIDRLVESVLQAKIGDDWYPGNKKVSKNWPGFAPGDKGIANALARINFNASGIVNIKPKPPVLWIRGDKDLIVSDAAMFDIANLGALGLVHGWPGTQICPPQPMLKQTRSVLKRYQNNGGKYQEEVMQNTGHSPFLEKPKLFQNTLLKFWSE